MRNHDAQLQEERFHLLLPDAAAHVDELVADFNAKPIMGYAAGFWN